MSGDFHPVGKALSPAAWSHLVGQCTCLRAHCNGGWLGVLVRARLSDGQHQLYHVGLRGEIDGKCWRRLHVVWIVRLLIFVLLVLAPPLCVRVADGALAARCPCSEAVVWVKTRAESRVSGWRYILPNARVFEIHRSGRTNGQVCYRRLPIKLGDEEWAVYRVAAIGG